jgi:LruC domain-containing protein
MKKIKSKLISLLLVSALVIAIMDSCSKDKANNIVPVNEGIGSLVVNPNFKFSTTQVVKLKISTLDNTGAAVPDVRVDIYNDIPDKGGLIIMSASTDGTGVFSTTIKVPAGLDSLAIGTREIGFVSMQKVAIQAGTATCVFGGVQVVSSSKADVVPMARASNSQFQPLGSYDSNGVPTYLVRTNDVIDAAMLKDINATLPEFLALPSTHPQYFGETVEPNLVLTQPSSVWITFVHEGSANRNALCYYKYPAGHPPVTAADIDTMFIIFPNVSYAGSGGGLTSGNKVYLGTFAPGIEIGWALIISGWNGKTITNGSQIFYTDKALNPETDTKLQKQTVLCNDLGRGNFLLSFEENNRNAGNGSDDDFNDAVFYVTSNPVQAVDPTDIPLPDYTATDTDKDGISDNFDDFPADGSQAFNNYYPAQKTSGTLAFEDMWPSKGDYDLNDMVIDYNYNEVTNGKNQVVVIHAQFTLRATGAGFHNGFGIQLPVSPDMIASVSGNSVKKSFAGENPNGTEAGQSLATIIVFDDSYNELPYPGGSEIGVNTTPGATYVQPKILNVTIKMTKPVDISLVGIPPYNPFVIIDRDRTREVHLIDNPPTDLADKSLFGRAHDDSDPSTGRYYVTANNLPFAIDIAGPFDYPVEKAPVTSAYLHFSDWAISGGMLYWDWYKPVSGYRNSGDIYTH